MPGSTIILVIAALVYFHSNFFLFSTIDDTVNMPYMDEIFHVPQAQQYCVGNYDEWNEKITTLPGLYLLSSSILRLVGIAAKRADICDLFSLRLTNVILSALSFVIIYKIFFHINAKRIKNTKSSILLSIFSAVTISIFPLHYFFQFLYYTDVGSTLFILLCYYKHLQGSHYEASLFGAIAVLFRQTNIVWVVFCIGLALLSNIEKLVVKNQKSTGTNSIQIDESSLNNIIQARNKKHTNLFELISKPLTEAFGKDFDLLKFLTKLYREDFWGKKPLIYSEIFHVLDMNMLRPYLMVVSSFIMFLVVNNGIVVGDRSNHKASFHLVQLFYFLAFSCFFSVSSFLFNYKKMKSLVSFSSQNFKIILGLMLPIVCAVIGRFTYEHAFLLADNRHYTFYIWSRVFKRHQMIRFALAPVYIICAFLFYRNLASSGKTLGWSIVYFVCVFVSVVPQELLEFRYFIIPYFIYRLNIGQLTFKETLTEFFLYAVINTATIYLFLNRVFYWPNSQETQRFMW